MSVVKLIEAVQSGDPKNVQHVLSNFKRVKRYNNFNQAWLYAKVNEGLEGSKLTALHVACKCFSLAKTPEAQRNYNTIIEKLLAFGANPYAFSYMGHGRSSQDALTPIMACDGKMPKSLLDALTDKLERYAGGTTRNRFDKDIRYCRGATFAGTPDMWITFSGDCGYWRNDTKTTKAFEVEL